MKFRQAVFTLLLAKTNPIHFRFHYKFPNIPFWGILLKYSIAMMAVVILHFRRLALWIFMMRQGFQHVIMRASTPAPTISSLPHGRE